MKPEGQENSFEKANEDEQIVIEAESLDIMVEEVLPDGTHRKATFIAKGVQIKKSASNGKTQIPQWALVFVLILIAILIGLVASGPQEIWEWLKELIPTSASID